MGELPVVFREFSLKSYRKRDTGRVDCSPSKPRPLVRRLGFISYAMNGDPITEGLPTHTRHKIKEQRVTDPPSVDQTLLTLGRGLSSIERFDSFGRRWIVGEIRVGSGGELKGVGETVNEGEEYVRHRGSRSCDKGVLWGGTRVGCVSLETCLKGQGDKTDPLRTGDVGSSSPKKMYFVRDQRS